MTSTRRIDTDLIHAGEPHPRIGGAAVTPIFQSAVFEHRGGSGYHDIPYPRLNNLPNHAVLAGKLAVLEAGEDALVTASGMAAIATSLLTILGEGDHVLVQDCLYGGTHNLLTDDLPGLGIEHDVITASAPQTWHERLRPNTRAIYVEAITNPLVQVIDHRAVVAFARQHDLVSMIDSTFATPINFKPLVLGYDLVLHSATKYLNGHSDLVAGAVIGRRDLVDRVRHRLNHLGGSLDPHACFLLHRGLRTLALRVRHQNVSALAIAAFLAGRAEVARVHYPGLESHPQHAIARELFTGFGGMLAFELTGGAAAAEALLDRVELPLAGPSLGGVETLISIPAKLSHVGMSAAARARLGITEGLLRVSVGIEATEDLIADFAQALEV